MSEWALAQQTMRQRAVDCLVAKQTEELKTVFSEKVNNVLAVTVPKKRQRIERQLALHAAEKTEELVQIKNDEDRRIQESKSALRTLY